MEQEAQQAELANKAKEVALKGELLATKRKVSIIEELGLKKVVGLGGVTLVGLTALALVLYYLVGASK